MARMTSCHCRIACDIFFPDNQAVAAFSWQQSCCSSIWIGAVRETGTIEPSVALNRHLSRPSNASQLELEGPKHGNQCSESRDKFVIFALLLSWIYDSPLEPARLGPHRYNWSSVAIRPGSMPPTSPTNDRLLNHDADTGPTKQLHVTSMQPLRVLGTQNAGTRCALDKDEPAAHFVLDCLASLSRP